jgi:hypothetical protein
MFPGMFSHNAADDPYWQNPKWYNRDRPLFKKYLPIIKRVAQAGWQPVTAAECAGAHLLLERFGPDPSGSTYITVFNDTTQSQSGLLRADASTGTLPSLSKGVELLSGERISLPCQARLAPQEVKVFAFTEGTLPR